MVRNRDIEQGEAQAAVFEEMFRTLLRTPHRQVDETLAIHKEQFARDPNFYGKLALWSVMLGNNAVRDVNEIFLAILFNSEFQEHRDIAYVMLQNLPPFQVARICNTFAGWKEIVKHRSYDKKPLPVDGQHGITVRRAKFGARHPDESLRGTDMPLRTVKLAKKSKLRQELVRTKKVASNAVQFTIDTYEIWHDGLGRRGIKGALKKAIRAYLRTRERNEVGFQAACLRARNPLRRLYAMTNTLPGGDEGSWENQYIFRGVAAAGSRLEALQHLAACDDPTKQSEIIMDAKIPYTLAVSVVKNMVPSVRVALISVMSDQELLQNLGSIQKSGAMDNTEIKALVESRLKKAKKSKKGKVDALKGGIAAKVEGLDADIAKAAVELTDTKLKQHGEIQAKTVLMIDQSQSMDKAIEAGKQLGASIAQACVEGNPPLAFLFNTMPTPIVWRDMDGDVRAKSAWDEKLKMARATGGTKPSTVVRALMTNNTMAEQIVVVTDEGENNKGEFAAALKNYEQQLGVMPNVVIIRVGDFKQGYPWGVSDRMQKSCEAAGIPVDVMPCERIDDVSIPNLIQLLSRKSVFDLVMEILAIELPSREAWNRKNSVTPADLSSRKPSAAH